MNNQAGIFKGNSTTPTQQILRSRCFSTSLFDFFFQYWLALCAMLVGTKLCVGCRSYWSRLAFQPPGVFLEKFHQKTRRRHVAAPTDLEPPKGSVLGVVLGFGLGSGWSGPTCKAEIDHTRPAQSFVPTSHAHNPSPKIQVGSFSNSTWHVP